MGQVFEKEWEKEMMKFPKKELVKMIREIQTGTKDEKIVRINTLDQANNQVEGIINDLCEDIIDKDKAMSLMGEYTGRIMKVFWENAIIQIKENPEILNENS